MASCGPKIQAFRDLCILTLVHTVAAAAAAVAAQITAVFHAKSGCVDQFVCTPPVSTHIRKENYALWGIEVV